MRKVCLFLVLAFLLVPVTAFAGQKLVLSGFEAPGLTPPALRKLRKAYAELGIEIDVRIAEPSRALVSSKSGDTDGEVVRIGLVGDRYPTLVRVDVPLISVVAYGYTNRPELKDKSPDELKSLRAGHVRGAVFAENAARGFAEVWSADEPEQLFSMLKQKRLDIVFSRKIRAEEMIGKFGLDGVYPIPSTFREFPFYHYLNERHRALVSQIEKVLREQLSDEAEKAGKKES